jgi:hypothetical protein
MPHSLAKNVSHLIRSTNHRVPRLRADVRRDP